VDKIGSEYGLVVGCFECGEESSSSGVTELVAEDNQMIGLELRP
jgi:hypothetical protein